MFAAPYVSSDLVVGEPTNDCLPLMYCGQAEDESLSEEARAGFKESIEATHALSIAKEKSTLEWQTRELALAQVSAERNFKKKEIRLDMSDFERASGALSLRCDPSPLYCSATSWPQHSLAVANASELSMLRRTGDTCRLERFAT